MFPLLAHSTFGLPTMALVAAAQAGSLAAMRRREDAKPQTYIVPASVSYTHLTLPTN